MNKLMAMVLGLGLAVPTVSMISGCGCGSQGISTAGSMPSCCETLTEDRCDHGRRLARNFKLDSRQICEDWDYFWLQDEPSHLTPFFMPHKSH